ncbi:Uncharacterized protein dnm_023200 [Desulfonema magnum]|uniref:Uncharacterized protein n=1 Tax=Desulfonema magnum TaxID=45655 RepID=A0A975BIG9_9BACT|nr:Uncharacterized protein dnm_023200 [Desulfonema magnum]
MVIEYYIYPPVFQSNFLFSEFICGSLPYLIGKQEIVIVFC